jgi:hypothetical protein
MSLDQDIRSINESARKTFGSDVSILVARAKAWGNEDTCILVHGKRHADAAKGFARIKGAKISTDATEGRTYSIVTIA